MPDPAADANAVILDLTQIVLDIAGIADPTPLSDGSNAVISLARGDWLGAFLSGVSVVPYIGDAAKLGKFPRYLKTLEKVVNLARVDARFAAAARPLLTKLDTLLHLLPVEKLPASARGMLERMRELVGRALPGGGRAAARLDALAEDLLRRVFGSTQNVGRLPRENAKTIVTFFDKYNVAGKDPAKWAELVKGIDLHAVDPVGVVKFSPGELVAEYVELSRPADRQIGQWMVKARGAVSDRNIGLSGAGRTRKVYRVKSEVEVLKSKAAGAADHWTGGAAKPHTAVTVEDGKRVLKPAEQVAGGGDQYFLPGAWNFLEEVK